MPPAQCPECGRFLARALVLDLATEAADCPRCGHRLSAAMFPDVLGQAAAPDAPAEEPAAAAELRGDDVPTTDPEATSDERSVRPPDLDPGDVRHDAEGRDPLAGWDQPGGDVVELEAYRLGRRPPPDGAIVAGAGLAGALVGSTMTRRRGTGAALGLTLGVAAAAVARQVWRLPD